MRHLPSLASGRVSSLPLEEGKQRLIIDGVIENQVFHQTTGLHQQFPHFFVPKGPFHNFPLWTSCFERFCQTNKLHLLSNNKYISPLLLNQEGVYVCEREICNWTPSLWYHDYHDLDLLIIFQKYPRCHQQPI